jgi:opacity protein-like surface antigen
MKTFRYAARVLAAVAGAAALPAAAIEPIPETPGWRGFVVGGAGYADVKSNVVAGNGIVDIGQEVIGSVNDAPRSDDAVFPLVTGEVNYTFENRWQAFLGTSLEDAVTLDAVAQAGARKDLGANGTVQAGFLFSGVPTEVWEDPYAEGVKRRQTDRDSAGLRLQWDRILGSAFEFTFSYRDIAVDAERSGEGVLSVPCDAACRDLLRRDGDYYGWDLSYLFRLGEGRNHLLRPMLRYHVDDRDGEAISGDGYRLQLSYVYVVRDYTVVSNVAFGSRDFDAANPVFGRRTDSDRVALDATLFYRLPAASGRWQAVGSVLWGEDDSDVDFHDTEVFTLNLGAMYRFGAR